MSRSDGRTKPCCHGPNCTAGWIVGMLPGQMADAAGRGVDWELESQWPFNPFWVGLVTVAVLVAIGLLHVRFASRQSQSSEATTSPLRPGVLAGLRMLCLLIVAWMIGGWQIRRHETDLPEVVLLVDQSQSMQLPAALPNPDSNDAGPTRWQTLVQLLGEDQGALLRRLAEDYRVRIIRVGDTRAALDPNLSRALEQLREIQPTAPASRLGDQLAAVVDAQRGRSTAALVLISDGIVTSGMSLDDAAQSAAAQRLPIIVARTGSTQPPPQVELVEVVAESTAMVGDVVNVMARVRSAGIGDQPVRLRLVDSADGRELASIELDASDTSDAGTGGATRIGDLAFLADQPGLRRLEVRVDPVPGEIAVEDNRQQIRVDVRDESFRILLVQGEPSYEFRFLKHLLERATNQDGTRPLVELTSVLQSGDPRYADQDRAARALPPVDAETLNELDLIILSDCDPAGLGRVLQAKIADLVRQQGASLVVLSGPNFLPNQLAGTPLGNLLPIDPSVATRPQSAATPLGWKPTALGASLPSLRIGVDVTTWDDVPPIYWLVDAPRRRAGARVLLETTGDSELARPIVISQLVGNGQVWLHLTDETFRLQADSLRTDYYQRYWLQLVRALARRRSVDLDAPADLEVVGERFRQDVPIPFKVRLDPAMAAAAGGQVEVTVSDAEGTQLRFAGQPALLQGDAFQGTIEGLDPGTYRAVLTRPSGSDQPASDTFVVQDASPEQRQIQVDAELLDRIASTTSGAVVSAADGPAALLDRLPPGRAVRIRPLASIPIWNHWAIATLLFGLLSAEWILRRRWGSF